MMETEQPTVQRYIVSARPMTEATEVVLATDYDALEQRLAFEREALDAAVRPDVHAATVQRCKLQAEGIERDGELLTELRNRIAELEAAYSDLMNKTDIIRGKQQAMLHRMAEALRQAEVCIRNGRIAFDDEQDMTDWFIASAELQARLETLNADYRVDYLDGESTRTSMRRAEDEAEDM